MKITALAIGILMFGGVMIGISQLYGGVQIAYAPGGTANSSTFAKYNETAMRINQSTTKIANSLTKVAAKGFGDIWGTITESSVLFLDVVGLFMEIPNIMVTFMETSFGFLDIFGNVKWFVIIASSAIIIIVVMRGVAIVFKSEEP